MERICEHEHRKGHSVSGWINPHFGKRDIYCLIRMKTMARSKEGTEWQPNYTQWALFAAWTFEQAAALSLDINPEIAQSAECPAAPRAQYKKRLDVVNSHRYFSKWFPNSGCVEPHLFVAWARNCGLEFPAALAGAVPQQRPPDRHRIAHCCRPDELALLRLHVLIFSFAWVPASAHKPRILRSRTAASLGPKASCRAPPHRICWAARPARIATASHL